MNDFRKIWLPLADRFYRVAYHLLESRNDAEDAVQELYLKILSSGKDLSSVQNPAAYGITLLKNICIDRIRRQSARKAEPLEKAPPLETVPGQDRSEIKDTLRYLLAEMEKLPPNQRNVLKMRAIDGLEYEEISQRTGLSQVHVRVLVAKARKTLRSKI